MNLLILVPIIVFIVGLFIVGIIVQRKSRAEREKDYSTDYFIGGKKISGFVLAMTLVATYASVSSFVGGPGMAWKLGFSWVYYASIQIAASFLVLGVLGKKIALVGHQIGAVTIVDIIRHRYESDKLAELSAAIMLIFFSTTMVAQFVGGAKLFEAATGYSYKVGLLLFGLVVILYTAFGGFKGVALTDTICAVVMIIGTVLLAYGVIYSAGGYDSILLELDKNPDLLSPDAQGALPLGHFLSGWFLIGLCLLGLPQSAVRGLSYENTKALHNAMFYGTFVMGIMVLGMHFMGVFGRGVITDSSITDVDSIMPMLVVKSLSPILAGICITGPLAASMSTVSSLLIGASSNIIKDVFIERKRKKGETLSQKMIGRWALSITLVVGLIVFVLALNPPSFIVWINLFAFGGLEAAFFFTLVLGLFWKKANTMGAFSSMILGVGTYVVFTAFKLSFFEMHNIVWGILASAIGFIVGSFASKQNDRKVLEIYF